ncbi:MAG: DUF1552 domain-containing protein [Myxococcaceae bacterium]|nr:DUF1552 domain-containing protein [Myxococcaceae bacterium]
MSYRLSRRRFLSQLSSAGAALGLHRLLGAYDANAQATDKLRLLVIRRPNGTVRQEWLPGGNFGSIMQPFEGLRSRLLAFRNLNLVTSNGGNDSHEGGAVTLMTGTGIGTSRPPSNDDWRNTTASVDQLIARTTPALMGLRTLQLAAHNKQDGAPELANLHLSYSGADMPIAPDLDAALAANRIFSGVMTGDPAAARRVRNRAAVLDFAKGDLDRLRALAPAAERPALDAHQSSLEALRRQLATPSMMPTCAAPMVTGGQPGDTHNEVLANARRHFALIKAAFTCDLSRVVTFSWSAGASAVRFSGLYPGMAERQHHGRSHDSYDDAGVRRDIAAIDRWYSEQTAAFINELAATPDTGGGNLLDRTLVLYVSECAEGNHSFADMPILLFGGAQTRLVANRVLDVQGRSTNDLWLALAARFGAGVTSLGTAAQSQGALGGIFS